MSTLQMKKTDDGTIELWESKISFSPEDKDRVREDLPAFLKQLLEEQGHKVNAVLVTTSAEKCIKEAVEKGEGVLTCRKFHVAIPEEQRSKWIWVTCDGPSPVPPLGR